MAIIKKWKSRKTALSGNYACVSRDLLLMPLGVDTHTHTHTHTQTHTHTHTHTHTNAQTKTVSRNQGCMAEGRMHLNVMIGTFYTTCDTLQWWLMRTKEL